MGKKFKTITDPVHGNIGLTEVEADIMTSAVMQRLHNVRQLGLAHLVYPGANYTRFSHSIGACHNASRLLCAIEQNSSVEITEKLSQEYRLVAMLHDVGHYPFSHATEHVIKEHYVKNLVKHNTTEEDDVSKTASLPESITHEQLGEKIIRLDEELLSIFRKHDIEADAIADRFAKLQPDNLIGIISSDLDCDRLDYLRRTAHNSGAPYGSVDVNFLIERATCDSEGTFCFDGKALRAADHLLTARYYDYMQVPYNKTVVALEWSLVTCLEALFARGTLNLSASSVIEQVNISTWRYMDDQHVFGLFRALRADISQSRADALLVDHLDAILARKHAKMLAGWDEIVSRDNDQSEQKKRTAELSIEKFCKDKGFDKDRFFIWAVPVKFSKVHSGLRIKDQDAEVAESVQILEPTSGLAQPLVYFKNTLMHSLSKTVMAGLRVYYLAGEACPLSDALRVELIEQLRKVLGDQSI